MVNEARFPPLPGEKDEFAFPSYDQRLNLQQDEKILQLEREIAELHQRNLDRFDTTEILRLKIE